MGGNSGGGGGGGTTVTKSDPWDQQKPYLEYGFQQAQNQYKGNTPSYYPNDTLAPLSATTNQALALQKQRALSGNPLMNASQDALTQTANGSMLNSNPYLDANFKAGADAITRSYNDAVNGQTSGFAGSGRMGSGMQAFYQNQQNDTLAKNLGNLEAQTYYNNYNTERNNQLNATQLAPQFANADFQNLDALSSVGSAEDSNNQNILNSKIDRFNYDQNLPANKLAQYMGLVQGNYGGSGTTTATPTYSKGNIFGGALSGAATGAAIGSVVPGVGTAIGAGAGAIFGGLGSRFSDRRLKIDVAPIGKADNGLTIYRYRFIGEPTFQIGFMADEVDAVRPEAVEYDPSGYLRVDYGKATLVEA